MHRLQIATIRLLPLLMVVLSSCASIVKPSGGPKDSEGPQIIGAIPPPRVLNYRGDEVVIYFDEFIKPGNYSKDVFISPVQEVEPTVVVKNRHITIHFNSPLRDSTTYVINFGTGIKDFNEGNKMDKPFAYAFSTGDKLDTLKISGKVIFPWTGDGESGMKVLAFLADEVNGNDIFDLKPFYATETDKDGNFEIQYLREASYKVYAVRDVDNNYMYSSSRERVGVTERPVMNLSDSADLKRQLVLYSYTEDKEAPSVKNVKWSNDFTIRAEFNEQIRPRFDSLSLKIIAVDSASGEEKQVEQYRYLYDNTSQIFVESPFPRENTLFVRFENLMDSLGTYSDTTLILQKGQASKDDKGRFFDTPKVEGGSNEIELQSFFPLPNRLDSSFVHLIDSAGKSVPIRLTWQGYILRIFPDTTVIEPNIPYTLKLDSTIALPDGSLMDTTLRLPIVFTNPADYGSLSGEIVVDTLNPETQYVMLLIQAAQKKGAPVVRRVNGPGKFHFPYLPAGKYSIRLIKDDDGNGYLSPGSLKPYFLPEKVIVDPSPLEIKPNWAVEGYNVFPYEVEKKSKKLEGKDAKEGNPDSNQEDEDDED